MLKNFLSSFVPFENKRLTSWISLIGALILLGFFGKIGEKILDILLSLIAPFSPEIIKYVKIAANYTISVNLITIIIFVLLFFPIYRFFDKKLLGGLRRVTVFEDNFDFGNKGWLLNYWGSNNPDKTCRIENSNIVFEADNEDLLD